MKLENVKAYELIEERDVADLYSKGYLLKHKKTGARVFILENDDENKVFTIGFRTPPSDSTGVPHIMEHSVLCGSKSFPAKDPFVELVKGSLNTFLNAMTYPDKTVYPVASCNDKDFKNLMHVYMDAVFYPNIYTRPQIFKQEGWHYELESEDAELCINGVVYNEMKGAYSSADDMIDRYTYEALYPDTAYALESGGDPEVIPELTYEGFIAFHQKYYHPSNSYIYIYGNCDMAERLNWLDSEYLSNYEPLEVDSELTLQKPFDKLQETVKEFSITEEEPLEDNTYLAYAWSVDTVLNRELYLAFQILDYALLSSPGAPLKEKLIKSGLGKDVMSTYENGILQPYFSVIVKNANESDKERFIKTIREELGSLVKNGIDKKALKAGINYFEFKYREADFGAFPKGLMYGLQCFDSWLYDEKDPFKHISSTETIEYLKKKADEGYFEELIQKYFLDNTHSTIVVSKPVRGLNEKKEGALAAKLAEYKAALSKEEVEALVEDTRALKAYQEEPSTQEELKSIPLLEVADIEKKADELRNELVEENGIKFLFHDVKANGIGYVTLLFNMDSVPHEYLPYVGILKSLLTFISTENFSYTDLTNEINCNSGGIMVSTGIYNDANEDGKYISSLEIDAKMLKDKTDFVFDMIEEILFTSKLDEYDRIRELLMMVKSRMQMALMSAGHSAASMRAMSYFSASGCINENISGYSFYKFINELEADFENKKEELTLKLKECMSYILCKNKLLVDFTGSRDAFDEVRRRAAAFNDKLSDKSLEPVDPEFNYEKKNEGFKSASQVQYVAMAGNFKHAGYDYTGALKVLRVIMGYDYLWINVRVMGGAYGCMTSYNRSGISYFVSYRDPNLSETIDIYKNAADYLEGIEIDERDMNKYIIGTISDMDTPLTPKMRGNRDLTAYLAGITMEQLQKERDEVLGCSVDSIRALAGHIRAFVEQDNLCVIGGEQKIKDNAELFANVENLL